MAARIAPADPPFAPNVEGLIQRIVPAGAPPFTLFTTLARDPRLFERFVGRGFLGRGHLTLRQREIIVHRVTAQCGSEYEWGLHVAFFAEELGFGPIELHSLVHGGADDACWTPEDRLLIRLCDSLHAGCDVADALWRELSEAFSPEALLEAMMIAGNYRSVAYLTNALRLPLEACGARFPAP